MAHHKYYVVFHGGQWKVSYNEKHYGPYANQRAAYMDAAKAANEQGKQGHQAQVFIQRRDNNQWRAEWTYGKDPYPPPG
jgi:hypothetical protein